MSENGSIFVQKDLADGFTNFERLGKPTHVEKKLLNYFKRLHPVWTSTATIEGSCKLLCADPLRATRSLHGKNYLDKDKGRRGVVRYRLKKRVYDSLNRGKLR